MKVYSQYQPEVFYPPSPLSVFSNGIPIRTPFAVKIQIDDIPRYEQRTGMSNPMLNIFDVLDLSFVIRVLFSLLIILLSYDSFSGDKERGTLCQVLSNPIARVKILYGKFIGTLMIVCVTVCIMYLIATLMLHIIFHIAFSTEYYIRIFLISVATVIYLSVFTAIGILTSIKFRHSSTSLVMLLIIWFFLTILQPNINTYIISEFESKQWLDNYQSAIVQNDCDALKRLEQLQKEYGSILDLRSKRLYSSTTTGYGYSVSTLIRMETAIADADYDILQYTIRQVQLYRKMDECAEKEFDLYKNLYLNHLEKQLNLKRTIEIFSPASLFSRSVSTISRTDIDNIDGFFEQARSYRTEYLNFLDQKGIFSTNAQLFFSRLSKEEIDPAATKLRMANYSKNPLEIPWVEKQPPLDLRDAPLLIHRQSSIISDLGKVCWCLLPLILFLTIILQQSVKSLKSYDPRNV